MIQKLTHNYREFSSASYMSQGKIKKIYACKPSTLHKEIIVLKVNMLLSNLFEYMLRRTDGTNKHHKNS